MESISEENERQLAKLQEDLKQAEFEKKRRDKQLAALINEVGSFQKLRKKPKFQYFESTTYTASICAIHTISETRIQKCQKFSGLSWIRGEEEDDCFAGLRKEASGRDE